MKVAYGLLLKMMLLAVMFQPVQLWAANVASGKSYQLSFTPYFNEYAGHNDNSGTEAFVDKDTWYRGELTDGVYTTANYFGDCVRETQQGPVSIIVDLRGVYSVTSAKLQACGGGVYGGLYYPQKIEVYGLQTPGDSMPFDEFVATTASDNQSWTKLGELVTNETENGTAVIKNFEVTFSAANCRLIKFVLTDKQHSNSCMNLGEVEVYSTSTPTLDPSNTTLVDFPVGGRNAYFPLEFTGDSAPLRPKVFETILYDDFEDGALNTTLWTNTSAGTGIVSESGGKLTVQCGGNPWYTNMGKIQSNVSATLGAGQTVVLSACDNPVASEPSYGMQWTAWGASSSWGLADGDGNSIYVHTDDDNGALDIFIQKNGDWQVLDGIHPANLILYGWKIEWSEDRVVVKSNVWDVCFDSSDPCKNGGITWNIPSVGTSMYAFAEADAGGNSLVFDEMKLAVNYPEFRVAGGVSADMSDTPWGAQRATAQIIKNESGTGAEGTSLLRSLGIRSLRFWDNIWVNYRSHIEQVKVVNYTTGSSYGIPEDDNNYAYPYYNEILDYCAKNDFSCTIVVDTYYYDPVGDDIYTTPEIGATDPNDSNSLVCKAAQRNVAPIVQYYKDHKYTNGLIIEIGNESISYVGPEPKTATAQQHLNIIKAYATAVKNIDPNVGTSIYPWPDNGIYQLVASAGLGDLIDYAVTHHYAPRIDPGCVKQDVDAEKAALASAGMDHVSLLITEYGQDIYNASMITWTNAILQARLEFSMLANPDIDGYYEFPLFQSGKLIHSDTYFWTARRYYEDGNRPADAHPELGARYVKVPSGVVGTMCDNVAYDDILKWWPGKNSEVCGLMSRSAQGHKILLLNISDNSIPLSWSSSFNVGSISTLTSTGEQFSQTLTQPWSINADPNSGINPNLVLAPKSMMLLTENPVLVKASLPTPANSGTGVSINPTLSWTGGGMVANSRDVYFGTNQTDVNNATTASAEFKGNQTGTMYAPGMLSTTTTYYWRVDERAVSGDFVKGDVWSFTTETPPTFVSAGNVTSGTGAITPALPGSIATGDILLLFIETSNQAVSISNQNGGTWTQVTNSPQYTGTAAGTTGVRLAAYWSRYNGTQGNPTVSDSGNHQMGRIVAIRGAVSSGNPWDVTIGGVEAASDTSGSIPGATTTVTSTLVITAIASALPDATGTSNFSSWTNANLTSLTERTDNTVTAGNGGGIGIATGIKATAGAYGNTAVTLGSSSYKAMMSIAIKP